MKMNLLILALVGVLTSTATLGAEPTVGALLAKVEQSPKKGGYCSGTSLDKLSCGNMLPGVSTIPQIYERGWRVVTVFIVTAGYGGYDYKFVIIEEQ